MGRWGTIQFNKVKEKDGGNGARKFRLVGDTKLGTLLCRGCFHQPLSVNIYTFYYIYTSATSAFSLDSSRFSLWHDIFHIHVIAFCVFHQRLQ